MFSNPKLISIGLLLAILLFSLVFSSYVEGLENASISETDKAVADVNKNAPKSTLPDLEQKASDQKELGVDGIVLGKNKPFSVADITGTLQNNPGVQNLISNKGL